MEKGGKDKNRSRRRRGASSGKVMNSTCCSSFSSAYNLVTPRPRPPAVLAPDEAALAQSRGRNPGILPEALSRLSAFAHVVPTSDTSRCPSLCTWFSTQLKYFILCKDCPYPSLGCLAKLSHSFQQPQDTFPESLMELVLFHSFLLKCLSLPHTCQPLESRDRDLFTSIQYAVGTNNVWWKMDDGQVDEEEIKHSIPKQGEF